MKGSLLTLALILALHCTQAHAEQTQEEIDEMEEQRIQQALDNLSSPKGDQQENAFFKFEQMGEEAVPRLVGVIHDPKSKRMAVINAIHALGRLGPEARQSAAVIIAFLKSDDRDTRAVSAIALGKIGPASRDGVPMLTKLLEDEDPWVSASAYEALKKIRTVAALQAVKDFDAERKAAN